MTAAVAFCTGMAGVAGVIWYGILERMVFGW